MSSPEKSACNELGVFLAHSLALETEAAERLEELAGVMEVHNNFEAAAIFQKLAQYGRQHAEAVRELTAGRQLEQIAPWDFDWGGDDAPETSPMEEAHYRMTTAHAMAMALESESRARDFYAAVAAEAEDEEVRRYAEEFASEEATHVHYVENWIARQPAEAGPLPDDDDDPHMPE